MTLFDSKVKNKLLSPQHKVINLKDEWVISTLLEVLGWNIVYLDLNFINTENNFFDELFFKLKKINKVKYIFEDLWIDKLYTINDLQFLSEELNLWDLKIIFNNIDKANLEIQKIINTLMSYRERKIVYILLWDIKKYYFYTLFDDLHIREGDDYSVLYL